MTSIEWFIEKALNDYGRSILWQEIKMAKEMHKQEMSDSYKDNHIVDSNEMVEKTFNTNTMTNNKTTLSILSHGITATIDFDNKDVTVSEMFDAFTTAMIGVSYTPDQIKNHILDVAYEIQEMQQSN